MTVKVPGAGAINIGFQSAYIGTVSTYSDVVAVRFTRPVNSPGADYSLGVTIEVNASPSTITSAVRQSDQSIVYYTLDAEVDANDVVTWAYDSGTGDLEDTLNSTTVPTVTAQTATNYIGSHWWFNFDENSGHILTAGL